jgi:hypothetical protein
MNYEAVFLKNSDDISCIQDEEQWASVVLLLSCENHSCPLTGISSLFVSLFSHVTLNKPINGYKASLDPYVPAFVALNRIALNRHPNTSADNY